MQANPIIRLDDENLVESTFTQFRCPAEIVVPYNLYDPEVTGPLSAYLKSRFISSIWNMDSPWMMSIFGTLFCNFIGFILLVALRHAIPTAKVFAFAFSTFAMSTLMAIPLTYAILVTVNLRARYGKLWWRKLLGPTHIGITELGFKLYVRGKFFYNYPNLAVWKDIADVDVVTDSLYNVPAIAYRINSNYTFKNVILPITGFGSEAHLRAVLQHLREHVDKARQSEAFAALANAEFKPLLDSYHQLTSVPAIETER